MLDEKRGFAPGARLSGGDVVGLAALTAGCVALAEVAPDAGLLAAIAVVHFALFCNVFRVARSLELLWASTFVALSSGALALGTPSLLGAGTVACGLGLVVIALEVRKPNYHGVLWQRLNPGLEARWRASRGPGVV